MRREATAFRPNAASTWQGSHACLVGACRAGGAGAGLAPRLAGLAPRLAGRAGRGSPASTEAGGGPLDGGKRGQELVRSNTPSMEPITCSSPWNLRVTSNASTTAPPSHRDRRWRSTIQNSCMPEGDRMRAGCASTTAPPHIQIARWRSECAPAPQHAATCRTGLTASY